MRPPTGCNLPRGRVSKVRNARWAGGPRQRRRGRVQLPHKAWLLFELCSLRRGRRRRPPRPPTDWNSPRGCLSKERSAGWAFCAPAAPPRQRAAASQSWTPAIVARRRGRRRRAMRLPTGRNSPQECLEFCTGPPVSVCLCRHWYEHCTRLPISKLRCPASICFSKKKSRCS